MDHLAAVNLHALSLQVLYQRHPAWRYAPTVILDREDANGEVLLLNRQAKQHGIVAGMRYATALALTHELRAVAWMPLTSTLNQLRPLLNRFSPAIETLEPAGLFLLNATGLHRLYRSLTDWADALHQQLHQVGFVATIVIGFRRFFVQTIARSSRQRTVILQSPLDEQRRLAALPLSALPLPAAMVTLLHQLEMQTVGDFLKRPADTIFHRWGHDLYQLHRQASGLIVQPLQSDPTSPPLQVERWLDESESDLTRLLFMLKQDLDPLLKQASSQGEAVRALQLVLRFPKTETIHVIEPAHPTLDNQLLLDLVRLRLATQSMTIDLVGYRLSLDRQRIAYTQETLFATRPKRDKRAALQALARLRAEWGDQTIRRAQLSDGHLPEAQFTWATGSDLPIAKLTSREALPLIRRWYLQTRPLSSRMQQQLRSRLETDGHKARPYARLPRSTSPVDRAQSNPSPPPSRGAAFPETMQHHKTPSPPRGEGWGEGVNRRYGPYRISTGWWLQPTARDYYFIELTSGELLWVYHDTIHQQWRLQGRIE